MADWKIEFFKNPQTGECPALDFLDHIPDDVEGELTATLSAVEGTRPPFAFKGGLRWHAMRDDMSGFYEARDKHGDMLYRLFVHFERDPPGLPHNAIVMLDGDAKPDETAMPQHVYDRVVLYWGLYKLADPRSVCDSA